MSERALQHLRRQAGDDRQELQHHQAVLRSEVERLQAHAARIEAELRTAGDGLPPQLHEQFLHFDQACRHRQNDLATKRAQLQETITFLQTKILQQYRRERSLSLLLEARQEARERRQRRRETGEIRELAVRQWLERQT